MLKEENKFNENDIFEGMPSVSALIKSIVHYNSTRHILYVYVDKAKLKTKSKKIAFLKAKAFELGFEIIFTDADKISQMCVGNTHGGIIAVSTPRSIPTLTLNSIKPKGVYYMLDGIEDPYNFGNALRSLYASGADGIIVGERNWLGVSGTVARASAGASELLPAYISAPDDAISMFKSVGYTVICAGIRDSESIFDTDLSKPLFVILGGEKRGISRSVLDHADKIVRIDYGTDEFQGSLSASASAAIFGFEILRYNKK